jgi:hypothetical protein
VLGWVSCGQARRCRCFDSTWIAAEAGSGTSARASVRGHPGLESHTLPGGGRGAMESVLAVLVGMGRHGISKAPANGALARAAATR